MGGLAVFPDEETKRKVRVFGGPLGYSHPLSPALIGSAIASAKIMLSDEIKVIQNELRERIDYCNLLLSKTQLVVASNPLTPIYFIGMGQPKVTYNIVKRLLDDGFFVNAALFPAVPIKNTGLRFTITRHIQMQDIKALIEAIEYHYPRVLAEEGKTNEDVQKAFKRTVNMATDHTIQNVKNVSEKKSDAVPAVQSYGIDTIFNASNEHSIYIEEARSITDINKEEWDRMLGNNGSFDWNGLASLEEVFKNNSKPEENWEFYYFIVRDANKQPVLATFFTSTVIKDDMFSFEAISQQLEALRKTDPYYLTSHALMMGSMLTEGDHYYLNREHPQWKQAFKLLLEKVAVIQESIHANTILLRDFDKEDIELKELFINEGFANVNLPNSNIIEEMTWNTSDELLDFVSTNSRKNLKKDVFRDEDKFEIEYKKTLTDNEAEWFYELYKNVQTKNISVNMFPYPEKILKKLSANPQWEFVIVKLKPEYDNRAERKPVAVTWCYISKEHYSPMIIGLDYNYAYQYKVYKQATYQFLKRARILGFSKVFLGLSADFEKQKFGAKQHARVAYMQMTDNFHMEILESMSAVKHLV